MILHVSSALLIKVAGVLELISHTKALHHLPYPTCCTNHPDKLNVIYDRSTVLPNLPLQYRHFLSTTDDELLELALFFLELCYLTL